VQFTATANGTVSLSQASTGGSYTGVNPMGLFQLMSPTATTTTTAFFTIDDGAQPARMVAVAWAVNANTTFSVTRQTNTRAALIGRLMDQRP